MRVAQAVGYSTSLSCHDLLYSVERDISCNHSPLGHRLHRISPCRILGSLHEPVTYYPPTSFQSGDRYSPSGIRYWHGILYQTRTTGIILVTTFLHGFSFFQSTLAFNAFISNFTSIVTFQTLTISRYTSKFLELLPPGRVSCQLHLMHNYAILAYNFWSRMLPGSLGSSVSSALVGFVVTALGDSRQIIWASWVCMMSCQGYRRIYSTVSLH